MIKLPYFADPRNLEVEEEPEINDGPRGETSLELLQTVYRDRKQPLNVRVRCAVEALAHEYPRVSAVAVGHFDGKSYADQLERALMRSESVRNGSPPLLNSPVEPLPASEMKQPFSRLRRF